jgi:hypothetical protein
MADMDKYIVEKYIDFDIIESYKKPIKMPAKYLEVFSIVYKEFSSNKNRKIENWIVNISESKDLYIVEQYQNQYISPQYIYPYQP